MGIHRRLFSILPLAACLGCGRESPHATWRYAVDMNVSSPQVLMMGAEIAGHVDLVAIRDRVVSARFVDLKSIAPNEPARTRASELKKPVVIEYERDRLRGIRFHPGISSDTRRLWRQLANVLQLPQHEGSEWSSQEKDDTGTYRAQYRVAPDKSIVKQKLAYEQVPSPVSVTRSEWKLRPVPGSLWAETDASEQLELATITGAPIQVKVHVSATAAAGPTLDELPSDAPLDQPLLQADSIVTAEDVKRQHDESVTSGTSVRSLMREWRETTDMSRRALLGDRLAALFRVQPKTITDAEQLLGTNLEMTSWAFRALSQSGVPAAQAVLLKILTSSEGSDDRKSSAATALATTPRVDTQTCAALAQAIPTLKDGVKGTALLAYGAWVRLLLKQKDSAADKALRELVASTAGASGGAVDDYRRYLDALGNVGAQEAEAPLVAAIENPRDSVRETAVGALRAIPTESAARVIRKVMVNDASPKVREAAVVSASFRPIEPFVSTLREVLNRDSTPSVRRRAIDWLASQAREHEELKEIVENQAKTDPDRGVREQCRELLHGAARAQKVKGTP
jgi:hypothetical protein